MYVAKLTTTMNTKNNSYIATLTVVIQTSHTRQLKFQQINTKVFIFKQYENKR